MHLCIFWFFLKLIRFSLERLQKFVLGEIEDVARMLGALSRSSVESLRNWQQVEVMHRRIGQLSLRVLRKAQHKAGIQRF